MQTSATPTRFRSDIQGLRGIAVLLVVLYHAGLPLAHAGFIGVDIFFVISGFLITGLLQREAINNGRIALLRFFGRRIRRLLPAALVLLLFVCVVSAWLYPPLEQRDIYSAARAASLYLANIWFAGRAVDYLGGEAESNPMLHMWSLAVEEQFYIIWPLLIAALVATARAGRQQIRLLAGVALVCLVSLAACVWITWRSQPLAFFGTPLRAWEFGIGGLASLLGPRLLLLPQAGRNLLAALGTLLLLAGLALLDSGSLFPGVWALLPAGGTALLLAGLHGGQPSLQARVLGCWPLAKLGDVSYSWYLWHWPLLVFASVRWPQHGPMLTAGAVLLSLLLAWLSYRWVENPIRTHPALAQRDGVSIACAGLAALGSGAMLTLLMAQLAGSSSPAQKHFAAARNDLPTIYKQGCHADFETLTLPGCQFGASPGRHTVVLFGDSHAAHWFPALEQIARQRGWQLVSLTKSSCPSVEVDVFATAKRRQYHECSQWRGTMQQRILALKPALLILANSSRHGVSPAQWQDGTHATLQQLRSAGINTVLIGDTPRPGFDVPQCLARAEWQGRDPQRACVFQRNARAAEDIAIAAAEQRAVQQTGHGSWVDPGLAICPENECKVFSNGVVHYSDNNHLSATYARQLAPALQALLPQLP